MANAIVSRLEPMDPDEQDRVLKSNKAPAVADKAPTQAAPQQFPIPHVDKAPTDPELLKRCEAQHAKEVLDRRDDDRSRYRRPPKSVTVSEQDPATLVVQY